MISKEIFTSILQTYLRGIIILFFAFTINILAGYFKISSWYDLTIKIKDLGFFNAFSQLGIVSIGFLFIIYPLFLGLAVFIAIKYI